MNSLSFVSLALHSRFAKRLFSLHAALAASSEGAPLSLGPAPVSAALNRRGEGPGVGRPQQAAG